MCSGGVPKGLILSFPRHFHFRCSYDSKFLEFVGIVDGGVILKRERKDWTA